MKHTRQPYPEGIARSAKLPHVRVRPAERAAAERAALAAGQPLTEFIRNAVTDQAERTLAERRAA